MKGIPFNSSALQVDDCGSCCYFRELVVKCKQREIIQIPLLWQQIQLFVNPMESVRLHNDSAAASILPHTTVLCLNPQHFSLSLPNFSSYFLALRRNNLRISLSVSQSPCQLISFISLPPPLCFCSLLSYLTNSFTHPPTPVLISCLFDGNHMDVVSPRHEITL